MQSSDTISTKMHPATCRTKFEKMTEPITNDPQNFKWVLIGLPWTYDLQQVRFNIALFLFHLTYHPVKILISSEHDFQFSLDDDILASLALSFSRYICSEGFHSIVNRF